MADRLIRDELLRSHRYVTLSSDTIRLLFHHLILRADDLGNAEATTTALGLMMARHVDTATAAKWMGELADADLIRVYEANGKQYVHIPRFRQRLRYIKGKHPRPPPEIECNELKELLRKAGLKSVLSQSTVGPKTAEVKRSEEKRSKTNVRSDASRTPGFDQFWTAYPAAHRRVNRKGCVKVWNEMGFESILPTILAHVETMKASKSWRDGYEPAPLTYLRQKRWEDGSPELPLNSPGSKKVAL